MIWESSYWKKDLLKIAKKLEKRQNQKKWLDSSFANTEKDIMISAFMIRKLFESKKIDNIMEKENIKITSYPSNGCKINLLRRHSPEDFFKINTPITNQKSIKEICNQIIHSYVFTLILNDSNQLVSFWFMSDYNKSEQMIEITIFDYIKILKKIGTYWPSNETYTYNTKTNDFTVSHK